jgi:hypothetical protein
LIGCGGGDDASTVASGDGAPSAEEQYSEDYGEENYSGGSEEDGGGDEGYDSEGEESYEDDYDEEMEEDYGDYDEEDYEEEDYEEEMEEDYEDYEEEDYDEEDYMDSEEEYYDEEMDDYEEDGGDYPDGYGSGYGSGRPGSREPPKPLTLAEKAQAAFQQGQDWEAFQYLYGHAVTTDDQAATELLAKMGLLTPAKRPALAVRWGLGVVLSGPQGLNPYPIGTTQNQVGAAPRRGGGDGGYDDGGYDDDGGGLGEPEMGVVQGPRALGPGGGAPVGPGPATGGPIDPNLKRLTGELGQRLVDGLRERIAQGDFGQVLIVSSSGARRPSGGGYGSGYDSGYGEEDEDMYDEDEDGGYGSGGYGNRGYGSGGYGSVAGTRKRGPSQQAAGVVMLGVGNIKDLKTAAAQYNVDVLSVFNVNLKPNPRLQTVINETTIALWNMADGKETYESKKLNNIKVQVDRQNGKDDGVDKEMEDLFEHVDSTWKLGPMPQLTEEGVLNRLRAVFGESHENPLPILAEIRMYKTKGLLKDEFFNIANREVVNEQLANVMASGTEEEKKAAIAQWLPRE